MKGCRALTRNEIRNLVTIKDISARDKALFTLQLNTGCRVGEILSLQLKDVCSKFGVVYGSFELKARHTKTRHGGSITINSTAKKVLQQHCKKLIASGFKMTDSLFPSRQGRYGKTITRQRASQIYKTLFELAGIAGGKLNTHSMRKTFIGQIYGKTKDILLCKTLLRHANIASTFSYLESAMITVRQAVLDLNFS